MDVLESLRPREKAKIMDLVAEAGIDIGPWAVRQDGASIKEPAANPAYCYEWAFGGDDEPTALCIWHESLTDREGQITYEGNLRREALELDRAAEDYYKPQNVRSRAKEQARRARRFDRLLQGAYRQAKPIRVITLAGEMRRGGSEPGVQSAIVDYRLLDPEPWYVHVYADADGHCRLIRGVARLPDSTVADESPAFIDQFTIPEAALRLVVSGQVYERSPAVRRTALLRAGGKCEACSAPGFVMDSGSIYLETHHVFPLSNGGPDAEWNVVAICPNDHRRAHFGKGRVGLRSRLVDRLTQLYPRSRDALQTLSKAAENQ